MVNNHILVENKTDNLDTNNTIKKMYSLPSDGAEKMNTLESNDTCGDGIIAPKGEFVEILDFTHFSKVFRFTGQGDFGRIGRMPDTRLSIAKSSCTYR